MHGENIGEKGTLLRKINFHPSAGAASAARASIKGAPNENEAVN